MVEHMTFPRVKETHLLEEKKEVTEAVHVSCGNMNGHNIFLC